MSVFSLFFLFFLVASCDDSKPDSVDSTKNIQTSNNSSCSKKTIKELINNCSHTPQWLTKATANRESVSVTKVGLVT